MWPNNVDSFAVVYAVEEALPYRAYNDGYEGQSSDSNVIQLWCITVGLDFPFLAVLPFFFTSVSYETNGFKDV
jgi:hypothetical protein